MSFTSTHYALAEDEAEAFWFLGNLATLKAGGEKTGGALSVVEFMAPPGFATPYHVHHAEDEAFYVLEGSLAGVCGDTKWEAAVGSFVWLPKDVPHGYANTADGVTRSLTITLPAGFERFLAEIGEPAPSRTLPPPSPPPSEADTQRMMAASAQNQAEILGPPGAW
ncbi:MAG: cupin domain-containing protein [Candidatus Limnocylindrales bacterium]